MFGFINPKITYAQWLQATYHDIILDDKDCEKIHIINVPFFKCSIMMDNVISSFVGCVIYCDRPIVGYKNGDQIVSDLETIHQTYSGWSQYGDAVIWAHPQQRYKTPAQELYNKKGKKVNHLPLWYKSKLIQKRITACWNPKYLSACFNAQYLSALCIAHHGIVFTIPLLIFYNPSTNILQSFY